MAANKRKQDEKHLKMLREMVSLPHNKQCFDCHQRGPTYVNMTTGAFVCTACSGIMRGLNPPHRVKSISMTSFTPEEMEFLKSRGNEFCRKVYLGLYDSRTNPEPDAKDENKIRDFMVNKYEKKRWYCAPTETMHEDARKSNTTSSQPNQKPGQRLQMPPIRSTQGSATSLAAPPAQSVQRPVGSGQPLTITTPAPGQPAPPPSQPMPATPAQPTGGGMNLLDDLGGDPFAGSSTAPSQPATAAGGGGGGGGFADFANFDAAPTSAAAFPVAAAGFSGLNAAPPNSASFPAFPATSAAPAPPQRPSSTGPTSTAQSTGDKYAALADLSDMFGGGGGGGAPSVLNTVNWNGVQSADPSSTGVGQADPATSAVSWGGFGGAPATSSAAPVSAPSWGGGFGGGMTSSTSQPNMTQFSSGGNPFGNHAPPAAPQPSQGNPFMTQPPQQQPHPGVPPPSFQAATQFGQGIPTSFGQPSAPSAATFGQPSGQPPATFGQPPATFGQPSATFGQPIPAQSFGQPGGFGQVPAPHTNGTFPSTGAPTFPGSSAPAPAQPQWQAMFQAPSQSSTLPGQHPGMAYPDGHPGMPGGQPGGHPGMPGGQPGSKPGMFGQMGGVGQTGGWPQAQPAAGNPFMSMPPSEPMPPRANSTNPFL